MYNKQNIMELHHMHKKPKKLDNGCYRFEKKVYDGGLLDPSVDATYILHLEGNGRLEHIRHQLTLYHPTSVVYILFNKGYKNCDKRLHEEKPPIDLIDAFLQAFSHAQNHRYNNILILEDDFIFDPKISDITTLNAVNTFIHTKQDDDIMYLLGCLPFMLTPYDYYHNKIILSGGSHACVYTRKLRQRMLAVDQTTISDWDMYHTHNTKKYTYYQPLCYQLFPETENYKLWGMGDKSSSIEMIGGYIQKIYCKSVKLDEKVEPGYSIAYFLSKVGFYVIPASIILIACLSLRTQRKLRK